jgi:hypothetical protein
MNAKGLKQFAYISHQVHIFTESDLKQLMRKARLNNKELDLTGLLLFDGAHFLQVLEGPTANIDLMAAKIIADTRHRDVDIIYTKNNCHNREFGRWSMDCKILGEGLSKDYKELDTRVKHILSAAKPNTELAYQLLLEFRDMKNTFIDI